MKTKLSKILGVALTVALLSSLFVFAAPTPVSAGTLSWTPVAIPTLANNNLVAATTDVGPVCVGPDGTMYAARNDATTPLGVAPAVFRSPNGGYTWIPCGGLTGAAIGDVVVDLEVANNGDIFVCTQTPAGGPGTGIVFRSTNGGASFGQLGVVTLVGTEVITCMSVAPNYDGVGIIAVGVSDAASAAVTGAVGRMVQVWGDLGVLNWASASALAPAAADVLALQFSPNYAADNTIIAVTALAAATPNLRAILGGAWTWDPATQYPTPVAVGSTSLDFDGVGLLAVSDTLACDIALPYDFNGTSPPFRNTIVSIVSENVAVGFTNVFRINNLIPGVALNPGVVLWDLDFAGNYRAADSLLMGGLFTRAAANEDVYYCSNYGDPVPLFYPSTNRPTGDTLAASLPPAGLNMLSSVRIDMADDFITSGLCVVGTTGNDSAFGVTTNKGQCWNERGLIDNAGAAITFPAGANIAVASEDANTMLMSSTSSVGGTDATDTNIWGTSDGGATWERQLCANFATPGAVVFAISETYNSDGIVYAGDTGTVNLYYSATQGQCWQLRTITATVGVTIGDLYAKGNTVYVADNGAAPFAVGKSINGGWTWPLNLAPATPATAAMTSIDVDGDTLVVGTANSSVYRSGDDNATWAQVGVAIAAAANTFVGVRGDQIYAQLANNGTIYRWTFGVSPVWYPESAPAANWIAATGGAATVLPVAGLGLVITPDDTLYALTPTASVVAGGPEVIYRSISPEFGPYAPLPFFEYMTGMAAATTGVSFDVGSADTDAGNVVVLLDGATNTCWSYGDTLSAGSAPPVLVGPADATALDFANVANLQVENALGVTNYNLWISNDSALINNINVANNQVPPATLVTVALPLAVGPVSVERPVYWMARATGPIRGPWSEIRSIIPQPIAAPNAPAALNVAIDDNGRASILPVLSWSAFHSATGYQIQIAEGGTEIAFDTPTIDETLGVTTSYVVSTALAYDTAYAFRVRALVSGGTTDWSASIGFRTEKAPVEVWTDPATGLTYPTREALEAAIAARAPTTPMYIWIVIAVGAILVIAVIWLIFTTRRG